jgi:hypothetical protein
VNRRSRHAALEQRSHSTLGERLGCNWRWLRWFSSVGEIDTLARSFAFDACARPRKVARDVSCPNPSCLFMLLSWKIHDVILFFSLVATLACSYVKVYVFSHFFRWNLWIVICYHESETAQSSWPSQSTTTSFIFSFSFLFNRLLAKSLLSTSTLARLPACRTRKTHAWSVCPSLVSCCFLLCPVERHDRIPHVLTSPRRYAVDCDHRATPPRSLKLTQSF